ncbi:FtsB family cell division protein [Weissella halotolerans]|uniref:Septum formation initiator n=1 Tax=Weissella halotolerans DSM 20190 TaxID=1123500 RepID=A0A0R2FPN6_9LACO|nr:septum formation initiator family protein [Weissella halotolerans]KRN30505.1 hypothetical protein IV68_GL001331 [Weissella halotolerans DSM 20190]
MENWKKQSNIQALNVAGKKEIDFRQKEVHYQQAIHRRRQWCCAAFMIVITIFAMVNFHVQYERNALAKQSVAEVTKNLDQAESNHADLSQQVKDLHSDEYLQRVLRKQRMYSKEGEVIFNLPD